MSASGRDIGELPKVEHPGRKRKGRKSLAYFLKTYFPAAFYLPWCPDHLKAIAKIERAALHGGLFVLAMPRGGGKTVIVVRGCIWVLAYGYRRFVPLIGPDASHAKEMLEGIKVELETNDRLLEDFPEMVYPIRTLERISNRVKGQTYQGKSTYIVWTTERIVLPTIPRSKASGGIVTVAGIEGRVRGMQFTRPDGEVARPDFVILDDPQTDESARSDHQVAVRLRIIDGAVLGLGGPRKRIAAVMPCTVIRKGDLADQTLDREKFPKWQGERTRMIITFPEDEDRWEQYAQIREDSLRNDGDGSEATAFYAKHRKAMDRGGEVSWQERVDPDDLSALQTAMNLKFDKPQVFWAEYQNEPLEEEDSTGEQATADQIAAKVNGHKRGAVPLGADHVAAYIDVQGKALYYVVVAWESKATGYVLDYGTYPQQRRRHFTLREITRTLRRAAPGAGLEGSIYAGLERWTASLCAKVWQREDGAALRIGRCLIDANWGQTTDVIYQFCRQSPHAAILTPGHGQFVGATTRQFSEYRRKRGDRVGHHWRMPNVRGRRQARYVLIDTNYWKSWVHARLVTAMGDPGCLSLYGTARADHRMFVEHLTAEVSVRVEARGRVVDEWKERKGNPDNHWFDCLVGCCVAGSMLGMALPDAGAAGGVRRKRKKVRLSDLQAARRI